MEYTHILLDDFQSASYWFEWDCVEPDRMTQLLGVDGSELGSDGNSEGYGDFHCVMVF